MTQMVRTEVAQARDEGRREALALTALAVSLVSFLNLLGAEKSILAIVLAILAIKGGGIPAVRQRASLAIGFAALHICTVLVVIVLFQEELGELVDLLRKLA